MSNLKQKNITTITESTPLSTNDIGEIVVNAISPDITIPDATDIIGVWYRIINAGTGNITVYYTGSATPVTTIGEGLSILLLSDGTNWIESICSVDLTYNNPLSESSNIVSLNYDTNTLDLDGSNKLKVKDNVYSLVSHTHVSATPTQYRVQIITGSTTLTLSDEIVECNSATDITVNLPSASSLAGFSLSISNINTGIVTIDAYSTQTINGDLTFSLYQDESITIVSNGSNWIVR
ncbi:MAG: hypothetical protein ACM3O3_12680 [Syntrophothermus sp.]